MHFAGYLTNLQFKGAYRKMDGERILGIVLSLTNTKIG